MKDAFKAKIDEARALGRDVPAVIEELFMDLIDTIEGEKPPVKSDQTKTTY